MTLGTACPVCCPWALLAESCRTPQLSPGCLQVQHSVPGVEARTSLLSLLWYRNAMNNPNWIRLQTVLWAAQLQELFIHIQRVFFKLFTYSVIVINKKRRNGSCIVMCFILLLVHTDHVCGHLIGPISVWADSKNSLHQFDTSTIRLNVWTQHYSSLW